MPFVQLTVALASELIHPDAAAAAAADSFTDIIQNPCFQVSTTDRGPAVPRYPSEHLALRTEQLAGPQNLRCHLAMITITKFYA